MASSHAFMRVYCARVFIRAESAGRRRTEDALRSGYIFYARKTRVFLNRYQLKTIFIFYTINITRIISLLQDMFSLFAFPHRHHSIYKHINFGNFSNSYNMFNLTFSNKPILFFFINDRFRDFKWI